MGVFAEYRAVMLAAQKKEALLLREPADKVCVLYGDCVYCFCGAVCSIDVRCTYLFGACKLQAIQCGLYITCKSLLRADPGAGA
jgi:hypothetical protein